MRILVHEFVSGGGLAGRDVPASLAREGSAMLTALVADLAAIRGHQIVTTVDARFPLTTPPGVEVVTLSPENHRRATRLGRLISSADAVWVVAPETHRCLERLASMVEQRGKMLLGPGAAAIRRASDKARLPRLLARHGVPHPVTRVIGPGRLGTDWIGEAKVAARAIGYPVVVKPARGAGCDGVSLVRNVRELRHALDAGREASGREPLLLQRYVPGVAASVSLLADGRNAVALTVNAQWVRASTSFLYRGGRTPLVHPLAGHAVEAAVRTCEALPGLRGYVGVDLVLTKSEAVVLEVNPRLTTAYLGVRSAFRGNDGQGENVAAMALAACSGALPTPPLLRRRIRFTSAGRIVSAIPLCSAPLRSTRSGAA